MITPDEIKKKAERKYHEILRSSLKSNDCFPFTLPSDKKLSDDFAKMNGEIEDLFSESKDRKGFGYKVVVARVKTRRHGIQDIPREIVFEDLTNYLKFLGKEQEFQLLEENFDKVVAVFPQLRQWMLDNTRVIISNDNIWPDLIKVCLWFVKSYVPDKFYLRELPISIHTKFIEENKGCLNVLLDELVPEIRVNPENTFEKRFGLKYDQPLVRFRVLDSIFWNVSWYDDISVPIKQFAANPIGCKRVFIIENKMNFLTFPKVSDSIAVWSKGFAIELFKTVEWLRDIEIYYWSDLDLQGFQMLSQLRSYFSHTKAFLMDMEIVEKYNEFIVPGNPVSAKVPSYLSDEEHAVYYFLLKNNFRLEQERIHLENVSLKLSELFESV